MRSAANATAPHPRPSVLGGAAHRAPRAGLTTFERETLAVFVGLARVVGLPKSYGEIYGLLYASAGPLNFGDIQARLSLSKGSVSQGIRALRAVGAVRLADIAGGDRKHFEPETELRKLVGGFLRESIRPHLDGSDRRLAAVGGHLGASPAGPAERKVLQARFDKLVRWHKQGRAVLPWIEKFLG